MTVTTSTSNDAKTQTVTFRVLQLLDGPHEDTITVSFGGSTSCDVQVPDFVPGKKYLISDLNVYLAKDNVGVTDAKKLKPSGLYRSNYCSLLEPLLEGVAQDGI